MKKKIRNIAIIAHVDHGKTSLIEKMLETVLPNLKKKGSKKTFIDSNQLEKERGITIFSKNIGISWKNYHINIIDTPGHSDFGAEVERVLSIVDSVLLIVDAIDGPMPQTRFVAHKSFKYHLKPIVVINKIDRIEKKPDWVINEIFDLFIDLNASEEQLDFPVIYTSALLGKSGKKFSCIKNSMIPLYETITKFSPSPKIQKGKNLQMQISQLEYDNYLGQIGIGKILQGKIKKNKNVIVTNKKGKIENGKILNILKYSGINKIPFEKAEAGEIIAITGLNNIKISDTVCDVGKPLPLPPIQIDPPTVKMFFSVNNSPFSGQEGKYVSGEKILQRLKKESKNDIALLIEKTKKTNTFCVSGRGELHLSILLENMRREGFELAISKPNIIFKKNNNYIEEPYENVVLNVLEEQQGAVMRIIGERKGSLKNITPCNNQRVKLEYCMTSRSLIGFRSKFNNITSGKGILYSSFSHYSKIDSQYQENRQSGVLISNKQGVATAFSLNNLQERGNLFIKPNQKVYEGQIIGIHNRTNDLTVNCLIGKKLTNMRASGSDEAIYLTPPINITLEYAISFINEEELIEITPNSIRIRKKILTKNQRKIKTREKKNKFIRSQKL